MIRSRNSISKNKIIRIKYDIIQLMGFRRERTINAEIIQIKIHQTFDILIYHNVPIKKNEY